jgi:hypothetical protein
MVSLSSIKLALCLRYTFRDHYDFNRAMLSKSLEKLHPKMDSLQDPNGLGVYKCKMLGGYFFTIQDPMLAPQAMTSTYASNSKWSNLCKLDKKLLASYEKKVQSSKDRENNYDRHAKKKQNELDDVVIFLANVKSKHNTTVCRNYNCPQIGQEWRELDYWDSGEAITLFNPARGKSVKQCLSDQGKLLKDKIEDADKVERIIKELNNGQQFTARQERRIVTQCLYLWKAYKIAVQCMNAWT